jgi:hypothetical protein
MNVFDSPKLKISRASAHIEELAKEISDFFESNQYRFITEKDADPVFSVIKLQDGGPLPEKISLIIGDVVHNLRSALDHLACGLIIRKEGSQALGSLRDVYFPITKDMATFEKKVKDVNGILRAGNDVVDAVRALKPYGCGNDGLATLHDLDNRDKHRLIIPIAEATVSSNLSIVVGSPDGGTFTFFIGSDEHVDFDEVLWRGPSDSFVFRGNFPPISLDVALHPSMGFAGRRITPWLSSLAKYLEDVVKAFEVFCARGAAFQPPAPISKEKPGVLRIE